MTTTTKKTTTKKQSTKSTNQQPSTNEQMVQNLMEIIKSTKLELIQTKHLVQLFQFNDGGKFIRRHLRKNFQSTHEYNDPWVWNNNDPQLIEIVQYFVEMGLTDTKKRLITNSLGTNWDVTKITIK